MTDNIVPFNANKPKEDVLHELHGRNLSFLEQIFTVMLGMSPGADAESISFTASQMTENLSLEDVTDLAGKFAAVFSEAVVASCGVDPGDPADYGVPFQNDPTRFMAWSLIATGLNEGAGDTQTQDLLAKKSLEEVSEWLEKTVVSYREFLGISK